MHLDEAKTLSVYTVGMIDLRLRSRHVAWAEKDTQRARGLRQLWACAAPVRT